MKLQRNCPRKDSFTEEARRVLTLDRMAEMSGLDFDSVQDIKDALEDSGSHLTLTLDTSAASDFEMDALYELSNTDADGNPLARHVELELSTFKRIRTDYRQ